MIEGQPLGGIEDMGIKGGGAMGGGGHAPCSY